LFYVPILVSEIKISLLDHRRVDAFESESVRLNLIVLWSFYISCIIDRYICSQYTIDIVLIFKNIRGKVYWRGSGTKMPLISIVSIRHVLRGEGMIHPLLVAI